MQQPITGQMLHDLATQKKQELGDETASWNEVSSHARKVYNFVAQRLNLEVVTPLQKEIENCQAAHHNMMDHGEAIYNDQCKIIADLQSEVKALRAVVRAYQELTDDVSCLSGEWFEVKAEID